MFGKKLAEQRQRAKRWQDSAEKSGRQVGPLERENTRLREALELLQKVEHDYRLVHDSYPSGSFVTGVAWDRLRKSGDAAREALAATPASVEPRATVQCGCVVGAVEGLVPDVDCEDCGGSGRVAASESLPPGELDPAARKVLDPVLGRIARDVAEEDPSEPVTLGPDEPRTEAAAAGRDEVWAQMTVITSVAGHLQRVGETHSAATLIEAVDRIYKAGPSAEPREPRSVKMPEPLPDQREYIERMDKMMPMEPRDEGSDRERLWRELWGLTAKESRMLFPIAWTHGMKQALSDEELKRAGDLRSMLGLDAERSAEPDEDKSGA